MRKQRVVVFLSESELKALKGISDRIGLTKGQYLRMVFLIGRERSERPTSLEER